jgi:hypothetical protein
VIGEVLATKKAMLVAKNTGVESPPERLAEGKPAVGERRKHPRFACGGDVTYCLEGSNTSVTVRLADISEGGCYLDSMSPLRPGTRMLLTIHAGAAPIRARAEVRVTHPGMGMGVAFLDMGDDDRLALRQLIQSLGGRPSETPTTSEAPASDKNAKIALQYLLEVLHRKGVLSQEDLSTAKNMLRG